MASDRERVPQVALLDRRHCCWCRRAAGAALPGQELPGVPVQPGDGLRHRGAGPEHADRLQRPDLAGPRRVLRGRRLHRGDPDGPVGVPYWATLPVAAVVCFVVGYLFGLPALRLEGHYLALATFALALAVPQMLKYKQHRGLDRRRAGHRADQAGAAVRLRLLDQPLSADQWLYFFALVVAALMFLLAWNLLRSRIGRALMAIRDHPIAADRHGHQPAAVQVADLRLSARLHRRGRRAGRDRRWPSSRPTASPSSCRSPSWSAWWSAASPRSRARSSAAIFIQFVPNIADEISKSAPCGDLRRAADRPDVPATAPA